jgi:hypothetical protein
MPALQEFSPGKLIGMSYKIGLGQPQHIMYVDQRDSAQEEFEITERIELTQDETTARETFRAEVARVEKTRQIVGLAPTKVHGLRYPTRRVTLTDIAGLVLAQEIFTGTNESQRQ